MLSTAEVRRRMLPSEGRVGGDIAIVPDPFQCDLKQVGRTSIDLRLGRWFTLLQQTRTSVIDLSQEREERSFTNREGRTSFVQFGHKFVLHPGRFVLASTFEWLSLPNSVAAYISGKSALGRMGLIIETAAGIHPGFSGCITLELFNCGEVPIGMFPGMRICQLFFHAVTGDEVQKETNFAGRRKATFGSYKPDPILGEMLKKNEGSTLF